MASLLLGLVLLMLGLKQVSGLVSGWHGLAIERSDFSSVTAVTAKTDAGPDLHFSDFATRVYDSLTALEWVASANLG